MGIIPSRATQHLLNGAPPLICRHPTSGLRHHGGPRAEIWHLLKQDLDFSPPQGVDGKTQPNDQHIIIKETVYSLVSSGTAARVQKANAYMSVSTMCFCVNNAKTQQEQQRDKGLYSPEGIPTLCEKKCIRIVFSLISQEFH